MISSTSSSSPDPDLVWPQRRHWLLGLGAGVIVIATFYWLTFGKGPSTEVRMVASERAVSALFVDGDHRIFIVNAEGARDARSVVGRLSAPWEATPVILVVSVARNNEEAIWETLQRTDTRQVVVVGIPGSDPDWIKIERYCRQQGIDISYIRDRTSISTTNAILTLIPPEQPDADQGESYLEIHRGDVAIMIELAGHPASERYHLAVTNDTKPLAAWSDIRVMPAGYDKDSDAGSIVLDAGERVDAVLLHDQIRLQGRPAESFERR